MRRFVLPVSPALTVLLLLVLSMGFSGNPAARAAEKYQSRLNQLLIRKSNLFLPTRIVLGEDNRFVVKAQPGSKVKLFLSPTPEGYVLANGTPLRVGEEMQEIAGEVPETGVLELTLTIPSEDALEGKILYVDAVVGPTDEALVPIDLMDATGRRTDSNSLVITKPSKMGGPTILPNMPGMNPQMFNQLTTLGDIFTNKDDKRKDLLDNGSIDSSRQMDRNPFIQRGAQPGLR